MWLLSALGALALIGIDQITKYMALTQLKPIGSTHWIPGLLDLTYVENRGVAFGFLSGQKWFILLLTSAVTIGLVVYFIKMPKTSEYRFLRLALVLVFAGAVGNMIDRFFRGYVVDFFEFAFVSFPVFNMADIFVVIGVGLLAFLILFVIKDPEEKEKKGDE